MFKPIHCSNSNSLGSCFFFLAAAAADDDDDDDEIGQFKKHI